MSKSNIIRNYVNQKRLNEFQSVLEKYLNTHDIDNPKEFYAVYDVHFIYGGYLCMSVSNSRGELYVYGTYIKGWGFRTVSDCIDNVDFFGEAILDAYYEDF